MPAHSSDLLLPFHPPKVNSRHRPPSALLSLPAVCFSLTYSKFLFTWEVDHSTPSPLTFTPIVPCLSFLEAEVPRVLLPPPFASWAFHLGTSKSAALYTLPPIKHTPGLPFRNVLGLEQSPHSSTPLPLGSILSAKTRHSPTLAVYWLTVSWAFHLGTSKGAFTHIPNTQFSTTPRWFSWFGNYEINGSWCWEWCKKMWRPCEHELWSGMKWWNMV